MFEWYVPVMTILIILLLWDVTGTRKDDEEDK